MDNEPLVLDLLEWIGPTPKAYAEVMSAWRTSCPRLTIWEDTLDAGYVAVSDQHVTLTETGLQFLRAHRS